ncbi:MAG TPA: hypothetical protein VEV16_03430 [Daejeonella sp.]|nr:hypothetical protein [Daejeonella sp.]
MNQNSLKPKTEARVLFIDPLRAAGKLLAQEPAGRRLCIYRTIWLRYFPLAKKRGVKTGMRLNEAIKICPEISPNPPLLKKKH